MIGEAGNGLNFIVPDSVEAVWHQGGGVVQLFVDGHLHMAMPQAKARDMANALLAAARVPDLAHAMATDGGAVMYSPLGGVMADSSDKFPKWTPEETRSSVVRQSHVIPGSDCDCGTVCA